MQPDELTRLADEIAESAHAGVTDENGDPYIEHPRAVARYVADAGGDAEQVAVALLHDTVEDTQWSLDDLRAAGMPERVVAGVDGISKRRGESRRDYIFRCDGNADSRFVKRRGDHRSNTDPERLALLPPERREHFERKYAQDEQWFEEAAAAAGRSL